MPLDALGRSLTEQPNQVRPPQLSASTVAESSLTPFLDTFSGTVARTVEVCQGEGVGDYPLITSAPRNCP